MGGDKVWWGKNTMSLEVLWVVFWVLVGLALVSIVILLVTELLSHDMFRCADSASGKPPASETPPEVPGAPSVKVSYGA